MGDDIKSFLVLLLNSCRAEDLQLRERYYTWHAGVEHSFTKSGLTDTMDKHLDS